MGACRSTLRRRGWRRQQRGPRRGGHRRRRLLQHRHQREGQPWTAASTTPPAAVAAVGGGSLNTADLENAMGRRELNDGLRVARDRRRRSNNTASGQAVTDRGRQQHAQDETRLAAGLPSRRMTTARSRVGLRSTRPFDRGISPASRPRGAGPVRRSAPGALTEGASRPPADGSWASHSMRRRSSASLEPISGREVRRALAARTDYSSDLNIGYRYEGNHSIRPTTGPMEQVYSRPYGVGEDRLPSPEDSNGARWRHQGVEPRATGRAAATARAGAPPDAVGGATVALEQRGAR